MFGRESPTSAGGSPGEQSGDHAQLPADDSLDGQWLLLVAVSTGGTSYFSARGDLSTLFEDLSLVRPTMSSLVPRVCELLGELLSPRWIGISARGEGDQVSQEVKTDVRERCSATGEAPDAARRRSLRKSRRGWRRCSTAPAGGLRRRRCGRGGGGRRAGAPPAGDRLQARDVPELGYFQHRPAASARASWLVKSAQLFAGYYKQPALIAEKIDADGFYRTGDVVAELGPDHVQFVDRRNNVLKLSQGEFVAVSKLEAAYERQPAGAADLSLRDQRSGPYLFAVVVPSEDALVGRSERRGPTVKAALGGRSRSPPERERNLPGPTRFHAISSSSRTRSASRTACCPGSASWPGPEAEGALWRGAGGAAVLDRGRPASELRELRNGGADRPVMETVCVRAVRAMLGLSAADVSPRRNSSNSAVIRCRR